MTWVTMRSFDSFRMSPRTCNDAGVEEDGEETPSGGQAVMEA